MKVLLLLIVALISLQIVSGKELKGSLVTKNDFAFLTNFCFDTEGVGNATFTFQVDNQVYNNSLKILFFDDASDSWPSVYHKDLTCEEIVAKAKGYQVIISGTQQREAFIDVTRPHYWYFALSNCGGDGIAVQYNIHMVNAGGEWSREFSFDAQGLAQMYLFFWLFFMVGLAIHAKGVWDLHQQESFHPIVRLLTGTIATETLSILCIFIHYAVYKQNGSGAPGLLGLVLNMGSQLTFMLLLILLAKGWAVSKAQITQKLILTIIVSAFLLTYISMFIWQNVGQDPASTLYVYETAPGIIILILRSFAMLYFIWNLRISHMEESDPTKRRFYLTFGGAYSVWFFALPFFVLLAVGFSAWYRLKVVTVLVLLTNTFGYFGLAFMLWPSRARDYFRITNSNVLLQGSNATPYDSL